MSSGGQGDKREHPTAKRLKDSREKGQTPRSREFAAAVGLCAAALALAWGGAVMTRALAQRLAHDLSELHRWGRVTISPEDMGGAVLDRSWWFVSTIAPLGGVVFVAVVAGFAMQGGIAVAPKALELQWNRLSPSSGFSKFKPAKAGADVVRACVSLVAVTLATVPLVQDQLAHASQLVALTSVDAARTTWDTVWSLLWRGALVLLAIGAADFLWQRFTWIKSLRMSRQDIKDELRGQEGSPEVKANIRRIQRDMARARMLTEVKTATVVLTNPTHYAVALRYQRERMAAPVVVAKGRDAVATRIRAVARDAGVPIVENPTLARALHAGAELGDVIPSALFTAVAEVLAYLVRIRQLVL